MVAQTTRVPPRGRVHAVSTGLLSTLDNRLGDTERDDVVRAWLSLPRRIYLDTSTLQTLYDFGGEIFEGESFEPVGRAAKVQGLADEVNALRTIFMVNERA